MCAAVGKCAGDEGADTRSCPILQVSNFFFGIIINSRLVLAVWSVRYVLSSAPPARALFLTAVFRSTIMKKKITAGSYTRNYVSVVDELPHAGEKRYRSRNSPLQGHRLRACGRAGWVHKYGNSGVLDLLYLCDRPRLNPVAAEHSKPDELFYYCY